MPRRAACPLARVIGLSCRVRVFAYTRPVDMRKQYDGLYALVVAEPRPGARGVPFARQRTPHAGGV
jgi:hypothetical protein